MTVESDNYGPKYKSFNFVWKSSNFKHNKVSGTETEWQMKVFTSIPNVTKNTGGYNYFIVLKSS